MKSRANAGRPLLFLVALILLLALLSIYLRTSFFWRGIFRRLFGRLKDKKGRPNDFRVKEKINEHEGGEGVISTSLFGRSGKYAIPLLNSKIYLPEGWSVRVYICPFLLGRYRQDFLDRDYEIFVMSEPSEGLSGTVWRFLPMGTGKKFLCLDADDFSTETHLTMSLPDKGLFEKWDEDPKDFIFFASSFVSPIMAGKWGSRAKFPGLRRLLERYDFTQRGGDEIFLKRFVWPRAKEMGYLRIKKFLEHLWLPLFES